jgi:predicted enzyme related to lactoylglutathione lyase
LYNRSKSNDKEQRMNLSHISLFSVPVRDQQAARDFYLDKLGFSLIRDDAFGPQRWIEVAPPGAQTTITLVTGEGHMPPGTQRGIVLETRDVQTDHAALKAKGVAISEIEQAPWGTYATFSDPDGNGWVLQQSAGR